MEAPKVVNAEITITSKHKVINWSETNKEGMKDLFEVLITPTRIIYSKFNAAGDIMERGESELDHN